MAIVPPEANTKSAPRAVSTAELLTQTGREFIIMIGKDGAGKTSAIVSLAALVQIMQPEAKFFVIDTENKFPTALRAYGEGVPTNISYHKCEDINDCTESLDVIMADRKEGDWLAVESMSRVWEKAQDKGYMAISGFDKFAYLDKRRAQKAAGLAQAPPIPKADEFWNIVKGAHDGAFIERFAQASSLNVVLSSVVAKPPKGNSFIKENETRKEARAEFGIDVGIEGAPRLPYYAETLCMFEMTGGKVQCRILRDSISKMENRRPTFEVPDHRGFAIAFWSNCRG